MESVEKDPGEVLPYGWTWNTWLDTSETITDSEYTVTPIGLTIDGDSYGNEATTVWLSGGTVDTDYVVMNTITTSIGKTSRRRLKVRVRLR